MDLPSLSTPPSDDPRPLVYVKKVPAEPQSFEDIQGSEYEGLWRGDGSRTSRSNRKQDILPGQSNPESQGRRREMGPEMEEGPER